MIGEGLSPFQREHRANKREHDLAGEDTRASVSRVIRGDRTLGLRYWIVVARGRDGLTFGSQVRRSRGAMTERPLLDAPSDTSRTARSERGLDDA